MVINTKRILADSFEELLEEKTFEEITIQAIVENCGASRMTFYRYFKDKYDLVGWIYKEEVDNFRKNHLGLETLDDFIKSITKFIYSKKHFFSEIFKYEGQNSFVSFFNEYSVDICKKQFEKEFGVNIPKEIIDSAEIFCPGVGNFYKLWVLRGFKESPDEITEIIIKNVPTNIKKYMK